ncbi:MAG: hypothetical protein R3E89_10950 [Thiolinea sp.]
MLREGKADIAVCTEEIGQASGLLSEKCYDWNHGLVLPEGHELIDELTWSGWPNIRC